MRPPCPTISYNKTEIHLVASISSIFAKYAIFPKTWWTGRGQEWGMQYPNNAIWERSSMRTWWYTPFSFFLANAHVPGLTTTHGQGGYQETIAFKYVYIRFGCSFVSSLHPILTLRVCAVPLHASLVFTSKIVRIKAGYEKCLLLTWPLRTSQNAINISPWFCNWLWAPDWSWRILAQTPQHPPHPPTTQIPMVQSHFYLNQGSFQRPRHAQDFPVARWASWWWMRIMSLGPISVDC